ncbi:glycosyltransferase involved in cell wall biosynthesis [Salinibacter ruber]|uniref:glycosyltransferase n=1 Tax=Salinibacter ruber TaxID=146919 RepID=UPI00216A04F6|nr:glycosyltransferase [Salinibacter ruber]MCS3935206.1 glycosyltransferase involved in cell wall biosynthesis [Salinibacter ruber]MCS4043241.1 glycosyltransferase involved in cell wall biosynthesis [Salinibacter ruber]
MATIVHLTSVHRPSDTRVFRKECRTLARAGHDVTLVVPAPESRQKEGVQILAVDQPTNRWMRVWRTAREVIRKGRKLEADVYHLHDPELLPWSWALLDSQSPRIYDMHEDFVAQLQTKDWVTKPLRPLLSRVAEIGLPVFLRNRPVIFAEASYAERYDWLRCTATVQNMPIVSDLVDIDETKFSTPTIGYIGDIRSDRGSKVTLRALGILQSQGYDVAWECVGPATADHEQVLATMKDRLGVQRVQMPGYLPPEQGWRRMARCHIGIAMLEKTPNFVGSYPTKLFEYMALGLPVVTSDIPMYRNVVEKAQCGLVADPKNPKDVAEAVAVLIDNPNRAHRMGKRGQLAVQESYNWEQEGRTLIEFYDTVIGASE